MNGQHLAETASKLLRTSYDALSKHEQEVIRKIAEGAHVSRNTNAEFRGGLTFGQRVSDRIASFGGSWPFILSFIGFLVVWVALNSFVLAQRGKAFDLYPYILLNLILSMLAALQAPVIMMSQNRQAAKDRLDAAHDYEVNLKAELDILRLHEKLDSLRDKQWGDLVAMQEKQIEILNRLLDARESGAQEDAAS